VPAEDGPLGGAIMATARSAGDPWAHERVVVMLDREKATAFVERYGRTLEG